MKKKRDTYKRTNVTYGQLDKVLRSFGFSRREFERDGKGVQYKHKETGASIILPLFPADDYVLGYHMVAVRGTLEVYGVADPSLFDAKLQKAG
jgi:predicted RNA binding protein YcfA (HicA-like mRNA interferase family)